MRCCQVTRRCGNANSIRGVIFNGEFTCFFVGRCNRTVDRLIEEDEGQLVVPDLTRCTATSQLVCFFLIASRGHGFDRRVNTVFNGLFVVLDHTLLRAIQVIHVGVLEPQGKHTNGGLDTAEVEVGFFLVLVEVQQGRTFAELMGPGEVSNSSPCLTGLSWHNQVCGDVHLHGPQIGEVATVQNKRAATAHTSTSAVFADTKNFTIKIPTIIGTFANDANLHFIAKVLVVRINIFQSFVQEFQMEITV